MSLFAEICLQLPSIISLSPTLNRQCLKVRFLSFTGKVGSVWDKADRLLVGDVYMVHTDILLSNGVPP
jgi:hypothetical protein